jgi:hypothetical protein
MFGRAAPFLAGVVVRGRGAWARPASAFALAAFFAAVFEPAAFFATDVTPTEL